MIYVDTTLRPTGSVYLDVLDPVGATATVAGFVLSRGRITAHAHHSTGMTGGVTRRTRIVARPHGTARITGRPPR